MPNVNPVTEMVDLIDESRSYESDVTAMQTAKQMYDQDAGSPEMIPAISGAIGPLGASEWSVGGGRLGRPGPRGRHERRPAAPTAASAARSTSAINSLETSRPAPPPRLSSSPPGS